MPSFNFNHEMSMDLQKKHTFLLLLVLLAPQSQGGPGDTVDQLRMGFTTVPLSDQGPSMIYDI